MSILDWLNLAGWSVVQLVEGLEAEIDRMRDEAATLGCLRSLTCQAQGKTLEGEANKLEALLDQHKKEGRS